jgi:hypothetical protein
MTYDTLDKDGNVKTLALLTDIDVRMQRYTFSHPNGLLFATQFAQIALAITEKAAFDDMRPPDTTQLDLCGALTRSKTFDEAALREMLMGTILRPECITAILIQIKNDGSFTKTPYQPLFNMRSSCSQRTMLRLSDPPSFASCLPCLRRDQVW